MAKASTKKVEENLEVVLNILAKEGEKLGTEDLDSQKNTNDAVVENKGNDALENKEIDKDADILQKESAVTVEIVEVSEIPEPNQNNSIDNADNTITESDDTQEENNDIDKLYSVSELAMNLRVPSWQLAALLKIMDVEDDAFVSEGDFINALERLTRRKMGTK